MRPNEGCNSCASLAGLVLSFIACFILLVMAPLAAHQSVLTESDLFPGVRRQHEGKQCERGYG